MAYTIFNDAMSFSRFAEIDGKTSALWSAPELSDLLSFQDLQKILSTHRFDHSRLRFAHFGTLVDQNYYLRREVDRRGNAYLRIDSTRLEALWSAGAALHLTSVDEIVPRIRTLCDELAGRFHARVQANVHAGGANSMGFAPHFDGHDVFVLVQAGPKKWTIGGTTDSPLPVAPQHKGNPPDASNQEIVLQKGDVFYMPRGTWHSAQASHAPVLHVTLAVDRPRGNDYVAWLLHNCIDKHLLFRRDAPILVDDRDVYLESMREQICSFINPETFAEYLRHSTDTPSRMLSIVTACASTTETDNEQRTQ